MNNDHGIWANTVTRRALAEATGLPLNEITTVADALNLRTLNGRYEHREARTIISILIARTRAHDDARRARLRDAMRRYSTPK